MMCYALGALDMFNGIYDFDKVTMTIFQPQKYNISTFEMDKIELLKWTENELLPKAGLTGFMGK